MTTPIPELVGPSEIAEMAGVSRQLVGMWAHRGKLPEPVAVLHMGRIWLRSDIEEWLASRST